MTRYRVRAAHPRRGGSLRITDRAGAVLAVSGEIVEDLDAELVASMLANGYLEPDTEQGED